jgi:hypothetical protein
MVARDGGVAAIEEGRAEWNFLLDDTSQGAPDGLARGPVGSMM